MWSSAADPFHRSPTPSPKITDYAIDAALFSPMRSCWQALMARHAAFTACAHADTSRR